jgi:hypothetical protein
MTAPSKVFLNFRNGLRPLPPGESIMYRKRAVFAVAVAAATAVTLKQSQRGFFE